MQEVNMFTRNSQIARVIIAALVIGLALIRLVFHEGLSGRMDTVFFIVFGTGLLLLLVPLQYLKSFKAGALEFSLEQPQVRGAISGLNADRIQNEKIQAHLLRLQDELLAIRGSRVLWIDDNPHGVVGERRLLRALEVEVVTAISSEAAVAILEADNDFDLIITDVYREGSGYKVTGGFRNHDGTNFIVWLRTNHTDPVVKKLPVVFYAAYPFDDLIGYTASARVHYPTPEICNSLEDLLPKVIKLLAESRTTPIPGTKKKKGSPARRQAPNPYPTAEFDDYPPGENPSADSYGIYGDISGGEEEEHLEESDDYPPGPPPPDSFAFNGPAGEEEEHFEGDEVPQATTKNKS